MNIIWLSDDQKITDFQNENVWCCKIICGLHKKPILYVQKSDPSIGFKIYKNIFNNKYYLSFQYINKIFYDYNDLYCGMYVLPTKYEVPLDIAIEMATAINSSCIKDIDSILNIKDILE